MIRLAILFAFACALNGCASVKIYDDPWCVDAGKFGAECFNTVSNVEYSLNKYEWDLRRLGQACTATEQPALGYTHIKIALEQLCADSRFCTTEQKAAIDQIARKVDNAIEESGGAEPFVTDDPAKTAEPDGVREIGLQPED